MSTIPAGVGGPDAIDPRLLRPYYLLYLNDTIDEYPATINLPLSPDITDLFIVSHGWHRNYYSGVAAYDRLISRLMLLRGRGKLPAPANFKAEFVALHWHSDPGEDAWLDRSGRRSKESFINNARQTFSFASCPDYLSVLEETFELFSQLCTGPGRVPSQIELDSPPGPDELDLSRWSAIYDRNKTRQNSPRPYLLDEIGNFLLNNAPSSISIDQKVMALWDCYHDALARRPLTNQDEAPSGYIGFITAFKRVLGFVLGVAPFLALGLGAKLPIAYWASKLLCWPLGLALWLTAGIEVKYRPDGLIQWLTEKSFQPLGMTWTSWRALTESFSIAAFGVDLGILALSLLICTLIYPMIGWFICFLMKLLNLATPRKANKVTFPRWILWTLSILYIVIPWVSGLFLFLFLGKWILKINQALFPQLIFREKSIPRNIFRTFVSYLLRLPTHLVRENLSKETALPGIIYTVDSQLAFWDMQKRGVSSGIKAAESLEKFLVNARTGNSDLRIHLIGHSFGGLVLLNLWHHLNKVKNHKIFLNTILLLESATASDWLLGEDALAKTVDTIASVFSRYDTANGFYYPLANGTRNACGFVGWKTVDNTAVRLPKIFTEGRPESEKESTMFASLADPPQAVTEADSKILNLDASRMIYQGPVATGGGHDDIFKDDVLYLSWAVIARSFSRSSATPPPSQNHG